MPGTAMNFKATCPIFALKSSVSEVFSTIVNLLSLGDIWRWTLYNQRKNPAISSTDEFRRFSGVATITLGPFSSLKITHFKFSVKFDGFLRFLIRQRIQLLYSVFQIQWQLVVFRKLSQDQLKMTFFSLSKGKILWLIFRGENSDSFWRAMSHFERKKKVEEVRDEQITIFRYCKTITQIRDLRTNLDWMLYWMLFVHPWLREDILLSLMNQSEKEYCLEMTNENARMRRILGRLSISYASKRLLGSIKSGDRINVYVWIKSVIRVRRSLMKPIQSGKFGKPLVNGLSFSISHRIMSKILNSDNPTFIEKSSFLNWLK